MSYLTMKRLAGCTLDLAGTDDLGGRKEAYSVL